MTKKKRREILGVRIAREFGTTVKGRTFHGLPTDETIYPLDYFGCNQLDQLIGSGNLKVIYAPAEVQQEEIEAAVIETAEEHNHA